MGGSLKRVSADVFEVVVAPVRFFDIWVQPRVRCIVRYGSSLMKKHNPLSDCPPCKCSLLEAAVVSIFCEPGQTCGRLLELPLRVDIRCVECILDGSPAVSELRLQERVQFDVHTCFRCQQGMYVYLDLLLCCHGYLCHRRNLMTPILQTLYCPSF